MRTIAYYVWRVEMAIRNLLNIFFYIKAPKCEDCKRWWWGSGCELIRNATHNSVCVYFDRKR